MGWVDELVRKGVVKVGGDPLPGAPSQPNIPGIGQVTIGRNMDAVRAAERYAAQNPGIPYRDLEQYVPLDRERGERVAGAFDRMAHAPGDPRVRSAYSALADETLAQYESMLSAGVEPYFIRGQDPYAASPYLSLIDLDKNKRLGVFPTDEGFGTLDEFDPDGNPLMEMSPFEIGGEPARVNDIFRAVHDYFGHAKPGVGFRAMGEENAYQSHAGMYSPLARLAAATETRGQNSWLNFGPYGERNRTAGIEDTVFADQKTGLLPNWAVSEGLTTDNRDAVDLAKLKGALDDSGRVRLHHWSMQDDLSLIDPSHYGKGLSGRSIAERNRSASPDFLRRSYYGIPADERAYRKERGLGNRQYEATLDPKQLYDPSVDSQGLWRTGDPTQNERNVFNAGYSGYYANHPQLGKVATIFDALPARRIAGLAGTAALGGMMAGGSQEAEAGPIDKALLAATQKKLDNGADLFDLTPEEQGVIFQSIDDQLSGIGEPSAADMAAMEKAEASLLEPELELDDTFPEYDGPQLPESALTEMTGGGPDTHMTSPLEELLADPVRSQLAREGGFKLDDSAFHSTRARFDAFDPTKVDIGTHMGTRDQAFNRWDQTRSWDGNEDDGIMIPLLHATENPLELNDVGAWDLGLSVARELERKFPGDEEISNLRSYLEDDFDRMTDEGMFPDEIGKSEENRMALDDINDLLQRRGYDSVVYNNTVETTEGLLPEAKERVLQKHRDAQYLDAYGALDMDQSEVEKRLKDTYAEIEAIKKDPANRYNKQSRIVLDPSKIRSPAAAFDPDKRKSANLLASMAGGGILGGMAITPQDVQAAGMEDALLATGQAAETLGRGLYGGAQSAITGSSEGLQTALGETTIQPSDQYKRGVGLLAGSAWDGLMNYEPLLRDQTVGEDLSAAWDWTKENVAPLWDQVPEDWQNRIMGTGMAVASMPFLPRGVRNFFDPRFDTRVKEQDKLATLSREVEQRPGNAPTASIFDFEGRPFIQTVSDRTDAGGLLTGINGTDLAVPVNMQGGQGYMFENPGSVWAMAKPQASAIMNKARELEAQTGQAPLLLPSRMAPTGGDYATMGGEAMLSYAASNMSKRAQKQLNRALKKTVPDWPGIENTEKALETYRNLPTPQRESVKQIMDRDFRDDGGLGIGEARLAVTDPAQVTAPDYGLQNVGEIFTGEMPYRSDHSTYEWAVPGQGIGALEETVDSFALNPELHRSQAPHRSLMMSTPSGILDEATLRRIQDIQKQGGYVDPKILRWLALAGAAGYIGSGMLEDDVKESSAAKAFQPRQYP